MIEQHLQEIDAELIRLLGKKIELLQETKSNDVIESDLIPILDRVGVPQFVWQNLVINCQAAVKSRLPTKTKTKPRKVTVIGGKGMMGSFFAQKLSAAGHQITILEHHDWHKAEVKRQE